MLRFILIVCLWACGLAVGLAEELPAQAATWFADGVRAYEAADYSAAAESFERASAANPGNDEYTHWLGKAYGHQAERANWVKAVKLAKRTRAAFERAVALNPENWEAVRDLAQFYADAPGFLGGDAAKATALRGRLPAAASAAPVAPAP